METTFADREPTVGLNPIYRLFLLAEENVVVFCSEKGAFYLEGPIALVVASLLDGTRSKAEVVSTFDVKTDADAAGLMIDLLLARGVAELSLAASSDDTPRN